jgi:ribulose-phosphate 3-epimerase
MTPVQIFPSILSADFARLGEEIRAVEAAGADAIHIDVMDGRFVPNLTVGPMVVAAARATTRLPLDVHLMIVEPDDLIPEFIDSGADSITVHVEACPHLHRTIQRIRQRGVRAGVAVNPATPVSSVEAILSEIGLLLLMSVNPGFGGQDFIPGVLKKVETARQMIVASNLSVQIQVDGGVRAANAKRLRDAGVSLFVAGSAIFSQPDYKAAIATLRQAIETGESP